MNNMIAALLDSPLAHELGWTLVHFLWQGAVVGALYAVLRHVVRRKSPACRYRLAMSAMAVMATLPVFTFMYLSHSAVDAIANEAVKTLASVTSTGITQDVSAPLSIFDHLKIWLQPLVPWAAPLWLLGVLCMTLRAWRGWRHAYRLRKKAEFIPLPEWNTVVESLRTLLGIRKLVQLAVSVSVTVPSVIGWLMPIILLPPSVIAGLTPLQMELILTHELAHIRRQDYLWNLLQIAVETLLFYHPVVHWVSHQARLEREQCCDDMVVRLHGNAIDYARALTELEGLRQPRTALVLGANGGQVLDRVHRLLGQPATNAAMSWLPLLLAAGLLLAGSLMPVFRQKSPLQAVLAARYTLMGQPQQARPQPVQVPAATVVPARINAVAFMQPALQPVHTLPTLGESVSAPLSALPVLATPTQTDVVASTAVPVHRTHAANRAGWRVVAQYAPIYPHLALERGIEGSAAVEFTLTPEGEVTNMRVSHVTGSQLFGQAAMDTIRRWRFAPVAVGGNPVAQHMAIEIEFRLTDSATGSGPCKISMGYLVCVN
ncbi:MAG: TonB family protein [Gammaproteobacteria bacterium]